MVGARLHQHQVVQHQAVKLITQAVVHQAEALAEIVNKHHQAADQDL